jgi:pimeloyl-ACP methyl ester carboxylesterase
VVIEHRLEPALKSIERQPVLLLHGDADRTAPIENVSALAGRMPDWRLRELAGGHHLPIHQPVEVARHLSAAFALTHAPTPAASSG